LVRYGADVAVIRYLAEPMKKVASKSGAGSGSGAALEKQVAGFIAKFDVPMQRLIRATRTAARRRLPTAIEMVYDNYNFLVFGFSSSERPSDAIISLAANAKGVGLCFIYGAKLPDPHKRLQGSGNQTRFLRLESAATLGEPQVEELIAAAVKQARTPLPESGRGYTIVRSVAAKQRPRRMATKTMGRGKK
jgi:Domain of unknown function (DU1801)